MAVSLGPTGLTLGSTTVSDWDDVGGGFDSGTIMLFQQTSAPTGWTKITTHNDKALRVVSGTVGSGGSSGFTTALGTPSLSGSTGNTTLSVDQMPSHRHSLRRDTGGDRGLDTAVSFRNSDTRGDRIGTQYYNGNTAETLMNYTGGGNSHNHTMSGTASINVQYVDVIFASKD